MDHFFCFCFCFCFRLLIKYGVAIGEKLHLQRPRLATGRANVVVAQDGSGNYRTIKEALDVSRRSGAARFVIHVKRGIY
ncbi:pectinesterase, partial [Sarracenia purpurea var. burkii]